MKARYSAITVWIATLAAAGHFPSANGADIVLTPAAGGGVSITNALGNTSRFRVAEDGVVTLPGLASTPGPTLGLCIQTTTGMIGTCAAAASVTSISAGTGLSGGTITSTGTLSIANGGIGPAQLADGAVTLAKIAGSGCTNGQVLKSNGAGWACGADNSAAGGVTGITATAPLGVTAGPTPNISLAAAVPVANGGTGRATLAANALLYGQGTDGVGTASGVAGQVLVGTAGAPAFTGSPSLSGNLSLGASSASAGNILKNFEVFLHDYNTGIFLGPLAGNFTMTGPGNIGIGLSALSANATGLDNVAIGTFALAANTVGGINTAVGSQALRNNTFGSHNTGVGSQALLINTTGTNNSALGYNALGFSSTGSNNTAVGDSALIFNNTGSGNTAIGVRALQVNGVMDYNTAVGYEALTGSTDGVNNVAVGTRALAGVTNGFENAALGRSAGESNTIGAGNTSVGYRALFSNTTSFNSTAVGAQALANSTGQGNVAIGAFAGAAITTGANNIMVANGGDAADNATTRIGGSQTRAFVAGIRGVTTGQANAVQVFVDSNGQLGTASSSRAVKEDIADMDAASDVLMRLRPVTFHYKSHVASGQDALQYGLIAEEVAEVAPQLAARSADGRIETVNYQFLAPMLLNEVKKQRATIAELERQLAAIKRRLGLE